MSVLGKVARGLLSGTAGYFNQVAINQQKEKENDALLLRQQALERYRQNLTNEGKTIDQTNRLEFDDRQTDNRITEKGFELGVRGTLAAQEDERKAAREAADDQREFQIWKQKQPIELQNQLTLEDFKQDRQDQRQNEGDNRTDARTVTARGVDAGGNVTLTYADGRIKRYKGMKPTPQSGGGLDYFGGSTAPVGPAAPAAETSVDTDAGVEAIDSGGAGGQKTYTAADFRQALAEAAQLKAKGDPRFKDKSPAEIRATIKAWFEQQGLKLSTNGG